MGNLATEPLGARIASSLLCAKVARKIAVGTPPWYTQSCNILHESISRMRTNPHVAPEETVLGAYTQNKIEFSQRS